MRSLQCDGPIAALGAPDCLWRPSALIRRTGRIRDATLGQRPAATRSTGDAHPPPRFAVLGIRGDDRLGPRRPARKVDLKAMVNVRRLQANPELGEFRMHAALAQHGIDLSPRTCGRILAPRPASGTPAESQAMPFAAAYRHHYWSVDIRYIEDHALAEPKLDYVISVLENDSRALLAGVISPRQDLTAHLIVLRARVEAHGAPDVLVSDCGGVFRANQAQTIYRALGIQKTEIDRGQPWQNDIESHFSIMRRMADHDFARAATWPELRSVHERFFQNDNHQPHAAHDERPKGRRSPASVLGWVQGA